MSFVNEKISEIDREMLDSFNLIKPISKSRCDARRWTIDRERSALLVGLEGQGFYGGDMPGFYALIWNKNVIKLETFSKANDSSPTYKEFWRKVTKIEAPECLFKDKDEMMELIKEAIIAEAIKFVKGCCEIKVNFDFIAKPIFIMEVQ